MRRLVGIAISILFAGLMSVSPSAQEATAKQQILAASKAWWDASLRADTATMGTIETDDFSLINNGVPEDKSRLERIRRRGPIERTQTLDVQKFEDYGSVATMSGFLNFTPAGQAPARFAFSEVWVRQGTAWRVKSAHYSRTMLIEVPGSSLRFRPISEADPELRKAMQKRNEAIKTRDAEAWGRLVTDDHLNITAIGLRETRADRMAFLRGPLGLGTFQESRDAEFRSYGDRVVIVASTTGSGGTAQSLVTEVWVKGDRGWQLAHRQATWK